MRDETKYLAIQSAGNIIGGYNGTPPTISGGALPGMKGPDLESWRDLLRPVFDAPYPAGYGDMTEPALRAIQDLQYIPRAYGIFPRS